MTYTGISRKLIRPSRNFTLKDIENEVVKLCGQGSHKNIIPLLAHGQLPNMPFYYLDMELCDLDLEAFIHNPWKVRMEERMKVHLPHFVPDLVPLLGLLQIRDIMKDITSGLQFVHSKGEVHRDLKPSNGNSLIHPSAAYL